MKMLRKTLLYLILTAAALSFVYPFYWMLLASFTPEKYLSNLVFLPAELTFDNFRSMFAKIPIGRALLNSLIVSAINTATALVFSSMAGYALSRMHFRGRNLIFIILIFTMSLPFLITLIPNYILMVKFGWIDTYLSLTIPFLVSGLAIIMFRQAFQTIPQALIDAAHIDGCGQMRIIFTILWPNIKPTIITVAILVFMSSWNEVLWPLIVIREEDLMTLPQMVTLFSVGGRAEAQVGVKLASAVFLAAPIIIAYAFFQKYFIQSMASSGLKD
jgi:ABC-type glycerol-3-phosphate transport system permease component